MSRTGRGNWLGREEEKATVAMPGPQPSGPMELVASYQALTAIELHPMVAVKDLTSTAATAVDLGMSGTMKLIPMVVL